MHQFRDPSKDNSFDRDAEFLQDPVQGDSRARLAPGKRTRTLRLVELMQDPVASPIVRQARERGAPPPIPHGLAPASSRGLLGTLYRKRAGDAQSGEQVEDQVARAQASSGRSLPLKLRRRLEMALGADLKDVRVHTGRDSATAATSVGALAFTLGRHIHFAPGQYDPESERGQELIAHEAAHTIQQDGASTSTSGDLTVSDPGDRYELEADRFAERFVRAARQPDALQSSARPVGGQRGLSPLSPISKSVLSRAIIHRKKNPVDVIAESIGTSEEKAKDALTKAGGNRGVVEQAIKRNFSEEDAKKIIESVPAGAGKPPPEVKNKDVTAEKKSGDPPQNAEGGNKGKPTGKPNGANGTPPGKGGKLGNETSPQAGALGDTASAGELQLVYQELVEHQAWAQARSNVGTAGSTERAAFIAQQAGQGAMSGFASGAVMGVATGIVGQLASRYVPIPGVGAIIAGGFAAYGLLTKDWAASFDTIGKFGEGSSDYEVIANTIAAISEVIDIVVNVMNVIAGIIGVISAVMWLISIITVGAASPLAATLSSIALGIVTVTGILDNINNLVLQPCVLLFRALHTFTSDADPSEVEAQGAGISDAANKAANALGGMAGGKVADAAGAKVKRMRHKAAKAKADAGSSTTVDGPNQATTTGVETPRVDGDGAPRVDGDGAPRVDGDGAPRVDGEGGPPRTDAEGGPPRTDAEGGTPRTEADAKAQAEATGQKAQSRWKNFKEGVAKGKENLRKAFADHSAKAKADELEFQNKLDEAEANARQQRNSEIDAEQQRRVQQAEQDMDAAVKKGKADADAEVNRQHGDDVAAANREKSRAQQDASSAQRSENRAALRERQKAVAEGMREHAAKNRQLAKAEADLKQQYETTKQQLEADGAPPEAVAAAKQQYDTDRAALAQERADAQSRWEQKHGEIDRTYNNKRTAAEQKKAAADSAAQQKYDQDVKRAGELKETRRQSLEDAARQKAEADRASTQEGIDQKYGENSDYRKNQQDRAGNKGARDESKRLANQDQFGKDTDDRSRMRKLWDFWSNKSGRDATKKAWQEAREARRRQIAKEENIWGDKPGPGDATGGPGGIANLIKPTVEGASKWAVGQDRKTEEEKKKEAADNKKKGFWERNIHPAIYEPGKYWTQGGWKKKFEESQKTQNSRFTGDNQAKGAKRERVDPNYKDPPGHPDDLKKIEKYVKDAYETKAQAEAAERDAKMKKAKADGDAPTIKKLKAEAEKAKGINKQHASAVKLKQQATADQKKRQANAESTLNQYGSRAAGITAITGPLAAFKGFMWIGRKLGSDSFAKMEKDADKLLKAFADMKLKMGAEQQKQPAKKAAIKAQQDKVEDIDAKNKKSDTTLNKADEDAKNLDDANQKKIAEGSEAISEASGQKQEYDGKAKSGEQAYADLRGKLVSWAQEHKAARDAAIAKQLGKDPGPSKDKVTIPTGDNATNKTGNNGGGGGGGGGGNTPKPKDGDNSKKNDNSAQPKDENQDPKEKGPKPTKDKPESKPKPKDPAQEKGPDTKNEKKDSDLKPKSPDEKAKPPEPKKKKAN